MMKRKFKGLVCMIKRSRIIKRSVLSHLCTCILNYDGTVSPCTLDWAKKVVIGDINHQTPQEVWKGEKLAQLQLAQLEGKRHKNRFL